MGLRLTIASVAVLAAFVAGGVSRASADDLPWLHQTPNQTAPGPATPGQVAPVVPAQPAPVQPATPPGATVAPVSPGPPQSVRGSAEVLDTANLMIDGRTVHLFGIQGEGAPYDAQMAAYLKSQGGFVNCAPHGGTDDAPYYVCRTKAGYDLAEAALYNGGARTSPDATPEYKRQEALARSAQRGIWARKKRERDSNAGLI